MNNFEIRQTFHQIAEISGKEINTNNTIVELLKPVKPDFILNNLGNSVMSITLCKNK